MITNIELYLKENIDNKLTIKKWPNENNFSLYLKESYVFHEMTILDTHCVLLESINEMPSINQIQKHIQQIQNHTNHKIVLFYKTITRYRRKSLIENRIAFVIEDGQMYLPFIGLDIKKAEEHFDIIKKKFTTTTQIAYLYFLYHEQDVLNTTDFAKKLGINKMTASRVLNDLYHANLINYEIGGETNRSKEYKRIPNPDYFLRGGDYLKTPVWKTIHTKTSPSGSLKAGLNALAELSMINPPSYPVLAIDRHKLNIEELDIIKNIDIIKDSNLIELELWDYDPKMFSNNNHVDLLSLYASLKDEKDERVEQALEEVLLGEEWYKD